MDGSLECRGHACGLLHKKQQSVSVVSHQVGGAFYNLLSEEEHQITMLIKKGVMWRATSTLILQFEMLL